MKATLTLGDTPVHLPTLVLTFVLATAGGLGARALGLPLPWLLGALFVTAGAALAGWRPLGEILGAPVFFRTGFVPVIGVSIGAAFTPEILNDLGRWWPSFAALLLYVPLAHAIGFQIARRLGRIDPVTGYYATMPGGFIEALTLGSAAGADEALLSVMQFLRLILCIVFIPLGFSIVTGEAVGSATGAVIGGADTVLSALDWVVLVVCGALGVIGGRAIGLPAALITGPILLSGLAHLLGWVEGGPPGWLINLTQLVIGTTLGARFAGRSPRVLWEGARVTGVIVAVTLVVAALFASVLNGLVGERWEAVFLAFAPGGLAEMSLVALSLEISVIYVTAHHVLRIMLAVVIAKVFAARTL